MGFIREIIAGGILYMLYAFAVFCVVVSLIGGVADIIYHSRRTAAQEEWVAEAAAEGEEFQRIDYAPNLMAGLACLILFAVSSLMAVMIFARRFGILTHILVICSAVLAGFIRFLPRPPLGTGTDGMAEVFAYLMLLGVFESALYRSYVFGLGREAEGNSA